MSQKMHPFSCTMIRNIKSLNLFLNNSGLIFTDLCGQIVAILTKKIIARLQSNDFNDQCAVTQMKFVTYYLFEYVLYQSRERTCIAMHYLHMAIVHSQVVIGLASH